MANFVSQILYCQVHLTEEAKWERKRLYYATFFSGVISLVMVLVFIFERGMDWDFIPFGIEPRQASGLLGIVFSPFIHADVGHLIGNVVAFFVLNTSLSYFYTSLSNKILVLSVIISGIILWLIGRDSYHVGASAIVFALSFFLFFSGIIRKHIPLIAMSLIVVFLYGNNVWHLFPWLPNDPISWEGHLAGGITGFLLAVTYRKQGPQKPVKVWDEDQTEEDNTEWNENELI